METLSITFAGDPQTYHVITDCNESDTCPGCGAGYKAGFIECECCRRPVRLSADGIDKEAIRSHFMRAYSGLSHGIAVLHSGEAIIPKAWP